MPNREDRRGGRGVKIEDTGVSRTQKLCKKSGSPLETVGDCGSEIKPKNGGTDKR